jgi:putative acid phosphatase of HAD superfamily subfamily IIIB
MERTKKIVRKDTVPRRLSTPESKNFSVHKGHEDPLIDALAPRSGYVVFDIDGTLANIEHRVHFIRDKRRKRYKEFFAASVDDKVIEPVRAILHAIHQQHKSKIILVSGRSDEVAQETIEWLKENGIYYDLLYLRRAGNHTQDDELKRQWLHDFPYRDKIWLVIDDRDRVVQMWRSEGLTCFQVAPGDF